MHIYISIYIYICNNYSCYHSSLFRNVSTVTTASILVIHSFPSRDPCQPSPGHPPVLSLPHSPLHPSPPALPYTLFPPQPHLLSEHFLFSPLTLSSSTSPFTFITLKKTFHGHLFYLLQWTVNQKKCFHVAKSGPVGKARLTRDIFLCY